MAWYCGWDGGGTHTTVLCTDRQGDRLAEASFGPLNPNGNPAETVAATIRDAAAFMASQTDGLCGCAMLVIGVAGASNADTVSFLQDQLEANGYHGGLRIVGDQEIALAGAIHGPGAVLVAGTGSVCCGRDAQGCLFRTGGYGYLIDDGGSGYAIGRDILTAVVRAEDGRGAATCLTSLVYDALQIHTIGELITWLYSSSVSKKEIAALAPLLQSALDKQDEVAQGIAEHAAQDLCDLVEALWHRAALTEGELALSGSILLKMPMIRARLTALLGTRIPLLRMVEPWGTAAEGAALMARTQETQ